MAQPAVIAIASAHAYLQRLGHTNSDLLHFLPVSLYWIPLVFAALTFGVAGALMTSALAVLASLPNWLLQWDKGMRVEEIFSLGIAVAASILIGWEVDRRREARRSADDYAAAAVRSQEEERRRLSLELHDDSVQELMAICHELDLVEGPSQQKAAAIRKSVDGVVENLRQMSTSLRPPVLEDLGAVPAVRGMLTEMAREAGFSDKLTVKGEQSRLPGDIELAVFRIAQEALRNVVKHAAASHVLVSIEFIPKEVVLEVSDDGAGFDPRATRGLAEGHLGLLGMKERAEMAGGRLEIHSKPGAGTKVVARLPRHGNTKPLSTEILNTKP